MTTTHQNTDVSPGVGPGSSVSCPSAELPTAYDAIRAINWSSLKNMAVSPLLYCWRIDNPEPPKPSLVIGAAIHCAILEPGKFDSRYAVFDGTRRGKELDRWQDENRGRESLKPHEMDHVRASAKAVKQHRVAAEILRGGRCEESLTWIDQDTGMQCKGRLDYIRPDVIVDLKSARAVDPRRFARAVSEYLYHGQLAWYHDGAIAAGRIPADAPPPFLVAVQSDEPFDVAAYQMNYQDLDVGRTLYRHLMRRLTECLAADWWPGVCPELEQLVLPPWIPGAEITLETEQGDF